MFRIISVFALFSLGIAALSGASRPAEWDQARELYQRTEYTQSLEQLHKLKQQDAETLQLAGQNYFMLGEYKKATEILEKAMQLDPNRSEVAYWLGRVYGRRAETSSFMTAPGYANKTRQMFERALELDPDNLEAASDLLDFYLAAPGFLGGGLNKAESLAKQIEAVNPAEGHYAQAQIQDKRKEYGEAEVHLRKAAELAPQQVSRVLDVARYLGKVGKLVESERMFDRAAKMAPEDPRVLYRRAETYISERRNLDEARRLLEQYLKSDLTPDLPTKEEARELLKKIPN